MLLSGGRTRGCGRGVSGGVWIEQSQVHLDQADLLTSLRLHAATGSFRRSEPPCRMRATPRSPWRQPCALLRTCQAWYGPARGSFAAKPCIRPGATALKVYEVDLLTCSRCGQPMKVLAVITDPPQVLTNPRHLVEVATDNLGFKKYDYVLHQEEINKPA